MRQILLVAIAALGVASLSAADPPCLRLISHEENLWTYGNAIDKNNIAHPLTVRCVGNDAVYTIYFNEFKSSETFIIKNVIEGDKVEWNGKIH